MFVGYMMDHAGNTYKMLNLRTKRIWRSCVIKWIATSIQHLDSIRKQDAKPPGTDDNDDDTVEQYVQATGVNLILADDDDKAAPGPVHQDDDMNSTDEEVQPAPVAPPSARRDKTLSAMRKLSMFYNPIATAYLDDQRSVSSEDTESTSNQSGREAATNVSEGTDGDLDGDLTPDHSVASVAIEYLPNFAFYTHNQVLTPTINEVKTLNFEDAFQHHFVEPTMFSEAYNHEDPEQRTKWHEAIRKEFRDMTNRGVWRKVKHSMIPMGHRCIKSKWVFKIKCDGVF